MKGIKSFIVVAIIFLMQISSVYALNVEESDLILSKGEKTTIDLYADLKEPTTKVSFSLVFTSYDVPASFKVIDTFTNKVTNSTKNTVTFSTTLEGRVKLGTIEINVSKSAKATKGSVKLTNPVATLENGKTSKLDPLELIVTIGSDTATKEKEKNLLKEITSDIVTIPLQDDVYTYEVSVKEDVTKLDLKAVAKDSNSKVVISNQKISELKDGKITITVTSKDNVKEQYTIKVNVLKAEKVEIDKEEFEADTSYKGKWVVVIIASVVALAFGVIINKREGK